MFGIVPDYSKENHIITMVLLGIVHEHHAK